MSALATGIGLAIAKIILESVSTITLNGYMFFLGALIILADGALSRNFIRTVTVRPAQLAFLFLVALLFTAATFCLYSALALAEPATVSFLSRIELVATLILATAFLKEKISLAELAGFIVVVFGLLLMRYQASVELSRAVVLVVTASFLFGAAEVLTKYKIDWINHRAFIFYRGLFMSAIYIALGLAIGRIVWITDLRLWGLLVLAAFFLPYLGRLGYLKAMQNITVSRASIIVQSQPLFAAAATLVIIGTFPPAREVAGGLLIIGGVLLIMYLERMGRTKLTGGATKTDSGDTIRPMNSRRRL